MLTIVCDIPYNIFIAEFAGMAELADALDSGSSEVTLMQVQVLFPAPDRTGLFFAKVKGNPVCFLPGF